MPGRTDRPTSRPDYDPAAFAKESDSRMATAARAQPDVNELLDPNSEVRLAARPPIGEFLSLETWAEGVRGRPRAIKSGDALRRLPLDPKRAFLLSLIDGSLDVETLIEVSGFERRDVLEMLRELEDRGVLVFQP